MMQPGRHVGQDARETHVVLCIRLERHGKVDVCPITEPDARALVGAKGEWSRDDLWRLDCGGLEEGQELVAIVCDGVQRLGGGLLRLTCFGRLLIFCLDGDNAVFVVVIVCIAGVFPFLRPICDGAIKNLQDLARLRLPVEDCSLCEK